MFRFKLFAINPGLDFVIVYIHNSSVWFGEFRNSFDLSGHGPLRDCSFGIGDGVLGQGVGGRWWRRGSPRFSVDCSVVKS